MKNIKEHTIHQNASILEALAQINRLDHALTLFVVNDKNQLQGTLTDGDIRRGFLSGNTLNDNVCEFVSETFHCLNSEIDVPQIKKLKSNGIKLLPVVNKNREIIKVYDLQRLKSILPVDAVIMAGGIGERLRPLTDNIPKPMLKIGPQPIIEYNIDRLISYGIETIYISVNYLKEQIIEYFGDGSTKGISIKYIEEKEPLGTAGALSLIENFQNDILLTNSDLFTNIDYEDFYLAFYDQQADMAIASVPYTVNIPYAILKEEKNIVKQFTEKPTNTHYANAGIYLIKNKFIKLFPKNTNFDTTDLMQKMIDMNLKLIHNPILGYWIDIGKKEDLEKAKEFVKRLK